MTSDYRRKLNFDKLKTHTKDSSVLEKLFSTDSILFDENFISTIINLGFINDYTINDFDKILMIQSVGIFNQFSKSTDEKADKSWDSIFDIYFQCITAQTDLNPNTLKIKICTLLKMKINIPNYSNSVNFRNTNVSISSNYKPKEVDRAELGCDISNMVKASFFSAIEYTEKQSFIYTPYTSSISLQGPILNMLVTNILLLQENLLQTASACGAKVKPFINNNTSEKIL